ncbi:solute carrier family 66 member 2 isoform X2 [Chrysoperla carnea]|uniref:solute carrier family 66 member 2 isoform X2 n=1 Tax=Chrysoperla carnea TaxID=189513 RepID=UPI001D0850F7|nr:solute carrier family 66 member 2 isoform X2 [Chrysoperla carnea]
MRNYNIMDWVIVDELELTVGDLVGWCSAGAMIIGGVIPYIPQYRQIKKTQDADGFSLHVCLALLIANTLRILFWFGNQYELPLLVQSVIMNLMMFAMVHLCVKVRNKNQIIKAREKIFSASTVEMARLIQASAKKRTSHTICDLETKYFWNWTDFQSYVDFILLFSVVSAALMYLLMDVSAFVEIVGFLAVFTEAMLGAPQFIRNFKNKSTEGMSLSMVIMWTCGDLFKTSYFLLRNAPLQFWVCGTLQVLLDLAILTQVQLYRKNTVKQRPKIPD